MNSRNVCPPSKKLQGQHVSKLSVALGVEEKKEDLTQSYDKSPYINGTLKKQSNNTKTS